MHLSTSRTSFASLCFVSRRSLSLILSMRAFFKLIYLASNSLLLHSNWAISALFLSISFLNERFSFSTLHKETAIVWVCLRKYVTVFCPLPSFVYQKCVYKYTVLVGKSKIFVVDFIKICEISWVSNLCEWIFLSDKSFYLCRCIEVTLNAVFLIF